MKKKKPGKVNASTLAAAPNSAEIIQRANLHPSKRFLFIGFLIVLAIAIATYFLFPQSTRNGLPATTSNSIAGHHADASFVGANSCKQCHQPEFKAWEGSHHKLAMQEANASTVLGDFNNTTFKHFDVESTFFKRNGKFMVRTDGADGKLADFEIRYTFGVWPLQQYLIGFPGGRFQTLGIAWDTRSKTEGGQRWFHTYPNEKIDHKDQLHWTGIYQNWNLQCAACHSTHLEKAYDASSNAYKTHFSEINVACESCHGPGSRHTAWAKTAKTDYATDADKGILALKSNWHGWKFASPEAWYAFNDKPTDPKPMNTCAACHARRSTITEHGKPDAPLADSHRLALLNEPNYYADGQQHEEVFVWGSFLQSKMYQRGVTCMNCHEPHALKLRAEGNALCLGCHNAKVFDTEKHSFHKAGTAGAQCVNCHMPAQNYMVIDARRDHSIRVPRPDLSTSIGSPNACTQCHTGKKPEWAAQAMDQWYGKTWRDRPQYGSTLHAGAVQGAKAIPALMALAQDPISPAIVRATAAVMVQPYMRPDLLQPARALLKDTDPLIRIAALGMIEPVDPLNRVLSVSPLLVDPIRGVRLEAARILADAPEAQVPAGRREALKAALKEYEQSLLQDADWPTSNVNLGNLYLRLGRSEEAIRAYQRALMLDPHFAGAYVNLADAYRQLNRDSESEAILRQGIVMLTNAADLHHALGLVLVRKKETTAALAELATAAKQAPDNARYAYVYAVGLQSAGDSAKALQILRDANARLPNDLEILGALISINREAGDLSAALVYAKKAAIILPNDTSVKALVAELEAKH